MERIKILSAALFLVAMAGFCDEVLTKDERVIALTLLGEARGEGKIGLSAVACVIQRRAWEKNINPAEVCLQKRQFAPWTGKNYRGEYRLKKEHELYYLWDSKEKMYARDLARRLNKNWRMPSDCIEDITNGANHFHAKGRKPSYLEGREPVKIIGNHLFYRIP